jgi:hypothetical protein
VKSEQERCLDYGLCPGSCPFRGVIWSSWVDDVGRGQKLKKLTLRAREVGMS